jgi:Tol biopolymer transport system component
VGGSSEEVLFNSARQLYTTQWLRDQTILFQSMGGKSLYRLPLTGEGKQSTLFQTEFDMDQPSVSADGRFIAYNSNESGRWEVYVASFPSFTNRRQISVAGGCQALWRKDGKELFYLTLEAKLMSVEWKATGALDGGIPR